MRGVGRVVLFNWPGYAAAVSTAALAALAPVPGPARYPLRAGAALAGTWIAAGLFATWWAYDRTPLYRWRWMAELLPAPPRRYAVVSTGLDEVSTTLRTLFPAARPVPVDLYDPQLTRGGSIRRARALVPPPADAQPARPDRLPVPDRTLDAVFLVFAAHELRAASQRRALFTEIARSLHPGGRLVLVEHCRDAANITAYGPGAWHFYPRGEWLRLGRDAGLTPVAQRTMTPLVHALAYQR